MVTLLVLRSFNTFFYKACNNHRKDIKEVTDDNLEEDNNNQYYNQKDGTIEIQTYMNKKH